MTNHRRGTGQPLLPDLRAPEARDRQRGLHGVHEWYHGGGIGIGPGFRAGQSFERSEQGFPGGEERHFPPEARTWRTGPRARPEDAPGYGSMGGGAYRTRPPQMLEGDRVRDLMTRRVTVIEPHMNLRAAARLMRRERVGALPVIELGRLIGILTDRDIVLRAVTEDRRVGVTAVGQVMTRDPVWCYADETVEDAAELMAVYRVRRLPVLDRTEQLVGIVSISDLAAARSAATGQVLATVAFGR